MRIKKAQSIYMEGNNTAVLLLHSYTSHTRDMKALAESIHQTLGFTCFAPLYRGHGEEAEALIPYTIDDWWEDTLESYQQLAKKYKQVFVIGLSVGGIFALKLAQQFPIERLVVMSVPADKSPIQVKQRIIEYAVRYKKLENKSEEQIQDELKKFEQLPMDSFERFQQFLLEMISDLSVITSPIAIYYGGRDEAIYQEGALEIAESVSSALIDLKRFENSSHLMTLSKEKDSLYKQIIQFLSPVV
ncbi:carboxylesterase [Psychrobacillus sp. OK032]|uniref:alpha/beta hydrolase n=1 Tax=Psychrobacillus sp. OK032 TaxID=1884358 RepID=UPI0008AE6CEB|nr:alpha/beta fold hydrolase [Psychrobacillus sp. OK032]SER79582.1 carboxylesterase [Psychrobacillus sp. OK032]